ncbi:hypothetical protein [Burkholderia lata]|uniref:hypothetical protein n=1 Tax=Burkholderia lata (strain ATCC 17760 / DSM 23089 / LMG 22485 / NCIMB 9086 / R18194 / 383) TaxID=482957 RepID=UPI001582DF2D|nr:hypothetical protein [Burkholderia lata]
MELKLQPAPGGIQAALAQQLALVVAHSKLGAQHLTGKKLYAQGPLPIYVGDITVAGAISRPRRVGWRFLIVDDNEPLAVADLEQRSRTELALSSVGYGNAAVYLQQALSRLECLPGVSREVRVFLIPRLHLHALWLAGRTPLYVVSGAGDQGADATLDRKTMHGWLIHQHHTILGRRTLTN